MCILVLKKAICYEDFLPVSNDGDESSSFETYKTYFKPIIVYLIMITTSQFMLFETTIQTQ